MNQKDIQAKHSPTPWRAEVEDTIVDADGNIVADIFGADDDQRQANTQLIDACVKACAGAENPEAVGDVIGTLSALVTLLDEEHELRDILTYIDVQGRAAIRKAGVKS